MEWFSSQTEQASITFNGNSFLRFLLVHLGKNIVKALFNSSYFLLIYMVSICKEKVRNILLLKSSNMFPISFLIDVVEEEELAKS